MVYALHVPILIILW